MEREVIFAEKIFALYEARHVGTKASDYGTK
jgi:hypothetical protein